MGGRYIETYVDVVQHVTSPDLGSFLSTNIIMSLSSTVGPREATHGVESDSERSSISFYKRGQPVSSRPHILPGYPYEQQQPWCCQ